MKFVRHMAAVAALALAATLSVGQTGSAKPAAKPSATPAAKASPAAAPSANKEPLDINTASSDQLKALPGIGDAYAKRIIEKRPYTMKNQLVSRGVVPQATYDKIAASIIAKRAAK